MNRSTLTFALVVCCLAASAQTDSSRLKTLAISLEKLSANRPIEKIYLQLNKPGYETGDTLWFKGYVTVGIHHQPSALSGILYVELIDTKDKLIKSLQLKNDNGITTGEFALDEKLQPGQYHIRAYTNWMRNAGPEYFYNRAITIGNSKSNAVVVLPSLSTNGDNITTKLAYTDKLGRVYDKREVIYEVRADTNLLYKGKAVTDAAGNITFAFPGKTAPGQRLSVVSHFKLVNGITIDKTTPLVLPNNNSIDVQFMPEGGQLVNEVRSKVAFKAISQNGLGTNITGTIVDNDNNEVAEFQSQHAGMGVFAFTPQADKTYTAKVGTQNIALPKAADKGFVLSVNNQDSSKLNIRIATNKTTLAELNGQSFYIIGQSNGAVYYTTAGKLDNQTFSIQIARDRFPTGIAQFTLFDANNQPLNERITFVKNPGELLNISLNSKKQAYTTKEKISLDFNIKDNGEKAAPGSFAVSVYNEDKQNGNENGESTILSDLLLTSDLKGYIEEPNYYFNPQNDQIQAKSDLDILMLTQGYRRYEWRDALNNTQVLQPLAYQPEKALTMSGQLTSANGKPVAKGSLKVLALAEKRAVTTETDADGHFKLDNIDFADSTKLVIQARKSNDGKNVNISLDDTHTVPVIYKSSMASLNESSIPAMLRSAQANGNPATVTTVRQKADTTQIAATIKAETPNAPAGGGKALKEVTIKENRYDKPDQSNLWGAVKPEIIVTGDQLQDYTNIITAISIKDPRLIVNGNHMLTDPIPHHGLVPIVVDGVVTKNSEMALLNADNIDNIKIVDNQAVKSQYGIPPTTLAPVMIITTKSAAGTWGANEKPDTMKNGKKLKEVTIKDHKIDKPDKSNLWGTTRPNAIVTGEQLQDYTGITSGLQFKMPGLLYKDGKLYDMVKLKDPKNVAPPKSVPVVIDGVYLDWREDLDSHVTVDQLENIKLVQGNQFKALYGVPFENINDQILLVTTKTHAGTWGTNEKPDTIKNAASRTAKNLKEVIIKDHVIDKPDKTNMWGSVRPDVIISGEKMQESAMTMMGLIANLPTLKYLDDHFYDPVAKHRFVDKLAMNPQEFANSPTTAVKKREDGIPVPILIDGKLVTPDDDLDALITPDDIENVKLVQSNSIKVNYGISYANPNDKLILITTKRAAGTLTAAVGDTIKVNKLNKNINLKEVTVKGRKNGDAELAPWIGKLPEHTANLNGPGHADVVLTAKDMADCLDVVDCVMNHLMGVKGSGDDMHFISGGQNGLKDPPAIKFMLDGNFATYDNLSSIQPQDIESVEVLKSLSFLNVYGTNASGGLIIFTTKIGTGLGGNDAIAFKSVPGVIYTKFNGYYKAKQFYEPKYTADNSKVTDNRTAVYWNPNITADEKGTLPLEFYNSDVKGTYRAVVEGIDNDGNIGRYVYRYVVK